MSLKCAFVLGILLISYDSSYAQIKCSAGRFKVYCLTTSNGIDTIVQSSKYPNDDTLGGIPTITGGIPPYKYTWACRDSSSFTFYGVKSASYFLNDTTIARPYLTKKEFWNATVTFHLNIIDSIGNKCHDSIIVFAPKQFKAYDDFITKCKLDTVHKSVGIGGRNYQPYIYTWSPNKYISDISVGDPLFWPPTDYSYVLSVEDTLGCKGADTQHIYVICDGHMNITNTKNKLVILNFHNPISSYSVYDWADKTRKRTVELYNALGQRIYTDRTHDKLEIGRLTRERGIYYLHIYPDGEEAQSWKIERE